MIDWTWMMKLGYDIKANLTYHKILRDVYFKKDDRWVPVDADTAHVCETIADAVKLGASDTRDDNGERIVPLLVSNRTLEYNSQYGYIRPFNNEYYQRIYDRDDELERINNNNNNNNNNEQLSSSSSSSTTNTTSPTLNHIISEQQHQQEEQDNDDVSATPVEGKLQLRKVNFNGIIRNAIGGFHLMIDKFVLTKTLARSDYLVPSILVEHGVVTGTYGMDGDMSDKPDRVWYLKDPRLNRSKGIQLFKKLDDALEICKADPSKRYIVQREMVPLLLNNTYKFDIRVMILFTFSPTSTNLYLFKEGVIRSTGAKYERGSTDTQQQFTNFCFQKEMNPEFENILPLRDWDTQDKTFKRIQQAVCEIFTNFMPRLNQLGHQGYTIFGLDFLIDELEKLHLLEVNYSPSMFIASSENVKSICRRAISQIPALALEPILFSTTPITGDWIHCLERVHLKKKVNNDNKDDDDDEDLDNFNLF
ncbi:hypothetical protein DFA_04058 [Cavenderia fasciculata]|uniref:Tubulin--tyrosine ligase n=1 Tax=Cavenderia fasciculata TaxID=261658 RepID=F4Q163_CACFS|nr:uncharacterized protein DFA_04058 [Cavenderia fasciculata]EGG18564.1 hypothetical protein DFA_04058 [Cavenderia fasciculata]|eukprot:XP_004366468.1 hypothetical protein DFA_04058 [Cavenderia fasciculata]